jgi:hypothetical protein
MKMGARRLKLLKPGVSKKTTTVRFGWTRDSDLWNSGENALDESERGGDKNSRSPDSRSKYLFSDGEGHVVLDL